MTHISEWVDLLATFFLYIPSLLGVIFGVCLTLSLIARNTLRKWIFLGIAVACLIVFTQVNSAFSEVIMEIMLNNQVSSTTTL